MLEIFQAKHLLDNYYFFKVYMGLNDTTYIMIPQVLKNVSFSLSSLYCNYLLRLCFAPTIKKNTELQCKKC